MSRRVGDTSRVFAKPRSESAHSASFHQRSIYSRAV